jgi:hypothetical protein
MSNSVKDKIYKMLDKIKDEQILTQVMEDVAFYTSQKDSVDVLSEEQLRQLEASMAEADKDQVISWSDFKDELSKWKMKS